MKKTISLVLVLSLVLASDIVNADFTFGTPMNLGPIVNSPDNDGLATFSSDGLELCFASDRPGGYGGLDLWVTSRTTTDDSWSIPVNLGPTVNSSYSEGYPNLSADGLTLYFSDFPYTATAPGRPGGFGTYDIWMTTRETTEDEWGEAVNLGPRINTSTHDVTPRISIDGLSLYFASYRPGGYGSSDIWVSTRATTDDDWGEPKNLGQPLNSEISHYAPTFSADGCTLFLFSRHPEPTYILMTTRATTDDDWDTPVKLGPPINNSYDNFKPEISADDSILYFSSTRPGGDGGYDIWQAPILPVVDLNGDGLVDAADMCIVVDHWGENYPLCDIGPTPLGDGIVNVQDLIVLA